MEPIEARPRLSIFLPKRLAHNQELDPIFLDHVRSILADQNATPGLPLVCQVSRISAELRHI
ncbi:hypothetical protein [Roseateles sp.]|uniref:hypothetical protein n=1 Tax=Roseateles sp. TaxID=1971397 RepID=UPI0031CE25ED